MQLKAGFVQECIEVRLTHASHIEFVVGDHLRLSSRSDRR